MSKMSEPPLKPIVAGKDTTAKVVTPPHQNPPSVSESLKNKIKKYNEK